jgi:hypothetical protein
MCSHGGQWGPGKGLHERSRVEPVSQSVCIPLPHFAFHSDHSGTSDLKSSHLGRAGGGLRAVAVGVAMHVSAAQLVVVGGGATPGFAFVGGEDSTSHTGCTSSNYLCWAHIPW